jgi:hypothetical protein
MCELPAGWLAGYNHANTDTTLCLLETRTTVCTLTLPRSKGHQWWFALDCTPHTPLACVFVC